MQKQQQQQRQRHFNHHHPHFFFFFRMLLRQILTKVLLLLCQRQMFCLLLTPTVLVPLLSGSITSTYALPLLSGSALPSSVINRRIVGGAFSRVEDSLFQVSVQTKSGGHFCGGAIVSKDYVVTAAHCLLEASADELQIRYNSLYHSRGGHLASVARILVHQQFDNLTNDHDIALLQTASPMLSVAPLSAVRLPNPTSVDVPADDQLITVFGWGALEENGTALAVQLKSVTVTVTSTKTCTAIYGDAITENMFCAGEPGGEVDACKGDSGSPAVSEKEPQLLLGIVSWGYGCARPMYPGVYTKVSNYVEWMLENGVVFNY